MNGLPSWHSGKEFACKAGDIRDAGDTGDPWVGEIPGSGGSPEVGNGNSLQYFCLENSMDRGTWQAILSIGSQKSQTQLST